MQKVILIVLVALMPVVAYIMFRKPATLFVSTESSGFSCRTDSDCFLVRESRCSTVTAINRSYLTEWGIYDGKLRISSTTVACKPVEPGGELMTNYRAACNAGRCRALLVNDL